MAKINFYDVPEVGVHPQYDVSLEKPIRAIELLYASTGRRAAEMTAVRIDWMTKRRRARAQMTRSLWPEIITRCPQFNSFGRNLTWC